MDKNKKDIKIVAGDGKDLDISPVYNHISSDKPKSANKSNKQIVIPKQNKKSK